MKKAPLLVPLKILERATGLARTLARARSSEALRASDARWETLTRFRSLATPTGSSPCSGAHTKKAPLLVPLKILERATGLEPASVSLGS